MDETRAEQIRFESDYWKAVIEEILTASHAVLAAATEVAGIPIAALPLVFLANADADVEALTSVRLRSRRALKQIEDAQGALLRMSEIAGGRGLAIEAEIHGEPA
jgi:hypothetical protein